MSIIAPASSRWSRPGRGAFAPPRAARCPRRRRTGRAGSAASPASTASSSSSRVISGSSSLTRALTACIAAIASLASAPERLASPIAFAAGVALGRARRRAPGSARSARSRSGERLHQPLVGAVAAACQRRPHRLRVTGDRSQVQHLARWAVWDCRRSAGLEFFGHELRERLGLVAGDDVLRHRAGGEPAVADRVQRRSSPTRAAGRSSGRPCTHGSARWSWSPGCRPR